MPRKVQRSTIAMLIAFPITLTLFIAAGFISSHITGQRRQADQARWTHNSRNIGLAKERLLATYIKNKEVGKHPNDIDQYPSESDLIAIMGTPEIRITHTGRARAPGIVWPLETIRVDPINEGESYMLWQTAIGQWDGFKVGADGRVREPELTLVLGPA